MANVIREDVIQLSFDIKDNGLKNLTKEMDALKKSVSGNFGKSNGTDKLKDGISDVADEAKKATSSVNKMKSGFEKLNSVKAKLDNIGSGLGKVDETLTKVAKKAGGAAYTGLKKLAGISFKGVAIGAGAAATAITAIAKSAVSAFGDNEQLVGGVETLFKNSANTVIKYANDAYKTAGLSANNYMETVTGFSASLLQSLGGDTEKSAKVADMAITDMADNANKMGTAMESIQFAYQGFAKQNYTIKSNSLAA